METKRNTNINKGFKGAVQNNLPLALVGTAVICTLLIIIALIMTMDTPDIEDLEHSEDDRIECPGLTEENCLKRYCVYEKVSRGPSCYMKRNAFSYEVLKVTNEKDGIMIQLKNLSYETPYGLSLKSVTFKLTYLTENILRFQFKDAEKDRYEVPVQEHFPLLQNPPTVNKDNLSYEIIHTNESDVFDFQVKRKNGTNIWDTRIGGILLSDQYLQIASYVPSDNIYGLGEHAHDTLKHSMDFVSWPMFARDIPPQAKDNRQNLYGVHPFYTCLEESGKSHGVFFLNSNAMEVTFMPAPAVSFRTIGGILDFFIFVGDNPEHVVQLYTSLIGRPMIPPYWALGFQLSRYGYNSLEELEKVLTRNQKAKIPVAVQYLDIDHMDQNKDFTYDSLNFKGLPEFIEKQKEEEDMKWVIILDPAIAADKNYLPYSSGLEQSVFIRRHHTWESSMFPEYLEEGITFGKVWPPEYVAFPDFFLNNTKEWWKELIVEHRKNISFDGIWIDMNEPANFETNEEYPNYCDGDPQDGDKCWALTCPESRYEDPPYNPLLAVNNDRISKKTLCMESLQGTNSSPFLHYDVHSLYGWSQTLPTLEAAQAATEQRSFVISRSTYPSSGRYAGHWLGDNESSFEHLRKSIIGMLEFNLFGIPYIGADVCGFFGNSTTHLCKRWMQLGAFYPYFRNHNGMGQTDQDPAVLEASEAEVSRLAIERRLSLNPYLYTLFYKAHMFGNTVVRPVFHEFPEDPLTWDLDTQFMWGNALLISPILTQDPKSVSVYLPNAEWWRFAKEQSWKEPFSERYVISTDADKYTPIHVRGGTILPYYKYDYDNFPQKTDSWNITLYVFPLDGEAFGDLFVDDGTSIDTIEKESYALFEFSLKNCSIKLSTTEKKNFTGPTLYLDSIVLFEETSIKTVSDKRSFTTDEKYEYSEINVDDKLNSVEEISWETTDGKCPKSI